MWLIARALERVAVDSFDAAEIFCRLAALAGKSTTNNWHYTLELTEFSLKVH